MDAPPVAQLLSVQLKRLGQGRAGQGREGRSGKEYLELLLHEPKLHRPDKLSRWITAQSAI